LRSIGSRERGGSYPDFFWNFKHGKFSSPDPAGIYLGQDTIVDSGSVKYRCDFCGRYIGILALGRMDRRCKRLPGSILNIKTCPGN